jgi:hypothetical protein
VVVDVVAAVFDEARDVVVNVRREDVTVGDTTGDVVVFQVFVREAAVLGRGIMVSEGKAASTK